MPQHPALAPGRVAVITGAASGIGLAAAQRLAGLGMRICLADIDQTALDAAAEKLAGSGAEVIALVTDVGRLEDIQRLHDRVMEEFGEVSVLMNNAGREGGGGLLTAPPGRWQAILQTNLWGVIYGIQVFAPTMVALRLPGAIINTGSKQGITCPPGDTAYNVSKAGIKVATEALAHDLRNLPGCAVTAHLLVPGFTFTGFTRIRVTDKPDAAWMPEQVVDFLLERMAAGDFYVICPDNAVTRDVDNKRIRWAAEDIIQNRPPLSRWHPDFSAAFAAYMTDSP